MPEWQHGCNENKQSCSTDLGFYPLRKTKKKTRLVMEPEETEICKSTVKKNKEQATIMSETKIGEAKTSEKSSKKNKSKNVHLRSLPPSIEALSDRIGLRKVPPDYVKSFLKEVLPRSKYTLDEFKAYSFNSDKFKKRRTAIRLKKRKTLLNANEQRKLAVYKLDPEGTTFQTFLPVHEMWKKYMQGVLQLKENLPDDLSNLHQKLLRADYHGCMIVVASSECNSYVGARGIVVQETRNVFRIITNENKIKTIPKRGSTFCFELCGHMIKIYGDNFRYVPYERSRIKYKTKSIVDT